jgi:hypothetical protein
LTALFTHLRCGFAAGRFFGGALPGHLGLLWGEANQRAELILMLWFPPRAICAEIPKQLSRSDQLINVAPAGLPFEPAVGLEAVEILREFRESGRGY